VLLVETLADLTFLGATLAKLSDSQFVSAGDYLNASRLNPGK